TSLVVLLGGYALFGRGLAHVGAAPLYLGEAVLGLGVLSLAYTTDIKKLGPIHWFIIAFMVMGAARTIPYIPIYGIDAFRDGVMWGYAVFTFAVAFALKPAHFPKIVSMYGRALPFLLVWIPVAGMISRMGIVPPFPGSDTSLLGFKSGDMGVHLGGAAAFMILGLGGQMTLRPRSFGPLSWVVWLCGLAVAGLNRGAMLAAGIPLLLASSLSPHRLVPLFATAVIVILLGLVFDVNIKLSDQDSRVISVEQFRANVSSIVSDKEDGLEGTKRWRKNWWDDIVAYTIHGPYFWTGKGFGINLANEDGYQLFEDDSLRAPHNSHLNLLARMGVPGLSLWLLVQVSFGFAMSMAFFKAMRDGSQFWAGVNAWIVLYWLAMIVDMSVDPYLEGPQGGIWFWSVIGAGLAALSAQRQGPAGDEAGRKAQSASAAHEHAGFLGEGS
ncbi:MAG TPA: O-antigen ligase family protein, partial [Candidatus Tectomicrobia bacterium]